MAAEENDEAVITEIRKRKEKLIQKFEQEEIKALMSGKYDLGNTLLSVHAGTGGIEAQDWAGMLLGMYQKYCWNKGFQVEILDLTKGEEAGIKSATLEVRGPYAFGYLKSEAGVHRLVRISPFDAEHLRHTSFALVEVVPEISDIEVKIKQEDLKIETFRSSGPGGQHAQKTESAVRITHLPTGLVASCQSQRSQYQNKINALRILKSKLFHWEKEQEKGAIAKIKGKVMASWGRQIRSYILHPYKMVKDHRTGLVSPDPDKVLGGALDEFIEAYLRLEKKSS